MHSLSIPGIGRVPFSFIHEPKQGTVLDSPQHSSTMNFFSHLKDRHSDKEKRKSLPFLGRPSSTGQSSPKPIIPKIAILDIVEESPPLVSYGPPDVSSGALLSAQLTLAVFVSEIKLKTLNMKLETKVTMTKPISKDCPECAVKVSQLKDWTFITEPTTYAAGSHFLPFSYLLPGSLPATAHSKIASIEYVLSAKATSDSCDDIVFSRVLVLQRALQPPELPRTAIRVFPPMPLQVKARVPQIIHPIGEYNVQFELFGIWYQNPNTGIKERWSIRHLEWHIQEYSESISAPCLHHSHKLAEGKGILQTDTRSIGTGNLDTGFKIDFDNEEEKEHLGWCGVEFTINVNPDLHPKAACDVHMSSTGVKVTHALTLRVVLSEAWSTKKSNRYQYSGRARQLRCVIPVVLTERAGMGVSWDEEQPPVYQSVPPSPPMYAGSAPALQSVEDFQEETLP